MVLLLLVAAVFSPKKPDYVSWAKKYFYNQGPEQSQVEKNHGHQTIPKSKFNESDFKELFPGWYLWRTIPLFDDSMMVTFGMKPTGWDDSGRMLTGHIYVTLFGWRGGKWVALWNLPEPVETDVWNGDPDYCKQYAVEPFAVQQKDIALVVARLGVQTNHPHSTVVALTVARSGKAVLRYSGFGYVTSMSKEIMLWRLYGRPLTKDIRSTGFHSEKANTTTSRSR